MPELAPITEIVSRQLEHWDGSGKPDGIKGDDIPIEARILGLVAYFQELTQARAEQPALPLEAAIEQCRARSGTRFDPALIEA